MSEGKFSQPRPHRDEERQIEESFRQLTEDKHRRKKVYTVEDEIGKTVRDITAQKVSVPEDRPRPFERSARLDETVQTAPGQGYIPSAQAQEAYSTPPVQQPYPAQPRQAYTAPTGRPYAVGETAEVPVWEDGDFPLEDYNTPQPVFREQPIFPEDAFPEEEPDFIDKLLNFGAAFKKHQTPIILGLCGAAVLLIVLFVSVFLTGDKAAPVSDDILPNVYIADISVGGLTKAEAIAKVKAATGNTYSSLDMVVDLSGTEIRLSPRNTKASLDVKAAVDAAYEYGRTGSKSQQELAYQNALTENHIIAALPYLQLDVDYIRNALFTYAEDTGSTLTQTSYGLEGDEPELSADRFNEKTPTQNLVILMGTPGIGFDAKDVYEKVLDAYSLHQFLVTVENVASVTEPDPIDLEKIYEEFYIAPVNASVNLQNFQTEPGSYGYGFDLKKAQAMVDKAQPGEVLRIPMEYIPPEILNQDAFFKDILGGHQTRGTGNDDRNRNLQVACNAINGTVLNPGESLAFRSLMSKVSGFRMAPEDTGLEDTERGGVTQVASTLYYAALMSDLNINSRSNHDYLPSFIDYGLDATEDLTITNITGYPIRIRAEYSGGYVKVEILGTEERNYYVILESSISSSTAPNTVYEDFPYDNSEGYKDGDILEEGRDGYLVKSYRLRYDRKTGKELSRDFITNSQYKALDRVIARVEEPVTEPSTEPPFVYPDELPTVPSDWFPTVPPTEQPSEAPTEAPTDPYTESTMPSEENHSSENTGHENAWNHFPFGFSWW